MSFAWRLAHIHCKIKSPLAIEFKGNSISNSLHRPLIDSLCGKHVFGRPCKCLFLKILNCFYCSRFCSLQIETFLKCGCIA